MSNEQIKKLAEQHANKNNENNKREEVKEMANQKEEKVITKVLDISREYVEDFYRKASKEDKEWMKGRTAELVLEKGDIKYFAAFRSEFAKKFFPELFTKKAGKKKVSMLDMFEQIDKE